MVLLAIVCIKQLRVASCCNTLHYMLQYINIQRGSGPGDAREAEQGKLAKEEHGRIQGPLREVS